MCTAAVYRTKDFYFGRTLDYGVSYDEEVAIMPRRCGIDFGGMGMLKRHYAMIGVAHVEKQYPMYYDAVNEKGLGMAGLNFTGNAVYKEKMRGKDNVPVYAFIPWILSQCATVEEARRLLKRMNLTKEPFCETIPPAQLHWLISDREESITVEAVEEGVLVYDNPVGVLTNNPPFPMQMFHLNNYMQLTPGPPTNRFSQSLSLQTYCVGMGAIGLPGDVSSQSRFVRAAFVKMNSVSGDSEAESVSQFFHILGSVEQQRGCCIAKDGAYEVTLYTSCCNADTGMYYYTTYDNHQITAVSLHAEDLEGELLARYPLVRNEQIPVINERNA